MSERVDRSRAGVGDQVEVLVSRSVPCAPALGGLRVETVERYGEVVAIHDDGWLTVRWIDDPSSREDVESWRVIARPNAPGG